MKVFIIRNRKRGMETSQVQSDSQTPEFLHCQQRRDNVRPILVINQYLHTGDKIIIVTTERM